MASDMTAPRRGSSRSLLILTSACLLLEAGGFLLVRMGGEGSSARSLLVLAPAWLWLILPSVSLVAGVLGRRCWPAVVSAGVLVAAAVLMAGFELATGSPGPDATSANSVRIVTWNVHNERDHVAEIREKLLAMQPDVVCLQEALDSDAFGDLLPGWHQAKVYAVRILSRWPIAEGEWFGLRDEEYRQWPACEVMTPSGPLVVLNVHFVQNLGGDSFERHDPDLARRLSRFAQLGANQIDVVLAALPPARPSVVAGDFNTPPRSAHYRALARRMTDAFAASEFGFGYTFLIGKLIPSWRIDYVWCANGVRPVRSQVWGARPSDHRPLVVDVQMPERSVDGRRRGR